MPLQTAQLGQLPYMNLARYVPERAPVEPAWHKALTAFLVNTAASTGKDLVSNALAKDYSGQATALGLPGAPAKDAPAQTFWSQVLHGPEWDKQQLQQGIRERAAEGHLQQQDKRLAQQLGISQAELDSLNKYREGELAARQKEMGVRESERKDTNEYRNADLAERKLRDQAEIQHMRDQFNNPALSAETALRNAQTQHYNLENDPTWQGKVKAAQMQEMMRAVGIDPGSLGGQPSNNNSSVNFHDTGSQTVPGSNPSVDTSLERYGVPPIPNQPSTTPSQMPPSVQNFSPVDMLNAREAANRNTAAGTSSQMGQSQQMAPTPPSNPTAAPTTQRQPLAQSVGETMTPSDLMSLVRPPETPNSPTAAQFSTPSQTQVPVPLDPDTMRKAAMIAKLLGTAGGMGGTPGQAGSGGLPLGYG